MVAISSITVPGVGKAERNLAVGWGMKKPYLENLGRRFGRLVAVGYVGVKSGSSSGGSPPRIGSH